MHFKHGVTAPCTVARRHLNRHLPLTGSERLPRCIGRHLGASQGRPARAARAKPSRGRPCRRPKRRRRAQGYLKDYCLSLLVVWTLTTVLDFVYYVLLNTAGEPSSPPKIK